MKKQKTLYQRVLEKLKNNIWFVIIGLIFLSVTSFAQLLSSFETIRDQVFGRHVLLKSIDEIELTTDLTPKILHKEYINGKQPPYEFPDIQVIWRAEIYEDQSQVSEFKVRVTSERILMDLNVRHYRLLSLLQQLKPGAEIIFSGTFNTQPEDLDIDIYVEEVFFDL